LASRPRPTAGEMQFVRVNTSLGHLRANVQYESPRHRAAEPTPTVREPAIFEIVIVTAVFGALSNCSAHVFAVARVMGAYGRGLRGGSVRMLAIQAGDASWRLRGGAGSPEDRRVQGERRCLWLPTVMRISNRAGQVIDCSLIVLAPSGAAKVFHLQERGVPSERRAALCIVHSSGRCPSPNIVLQSAAGMEDRAVTQFSAENPTSRASQSDTGHQGGITRSGLKKSNPIFGRTPYLSISNSIVPGYCSDGCSPTHSKLPST